MSTQSVTPNREAAIWARLIQSQSADLTPDTAKYFFGLGFSESDRRRMEELGDKSQSGTLTESEIAEFDSYLHVGNLLATMQSRARVVLANQQTSSPRA